MWCLKIKALEKWNIYNKRCLKFNVKIYFYSHNYYEENNKVFFVGSGIVEGNEKNKRAFFIDLKKDEQTHYLEINKDFFVCIYTEPKTNKRADITPIAYNPRIIFIKPVVIDEKGWEEWEIACTEKEVLNKFIKVIEDNKVEHKLFYLKKSKLDNLMIYSLIPKLTAKQQKAISLAVTEGYYGYPRKIKLEQLAKMDKISLSTYQFHLAKAEAKLLPFLVKKQK